MVIYPTEAQIELLIDAAAAGEQRVFGIEALSADPIFSHMAGGVVPSIDTIYRDLRRFDDQAIVDLEALMAKHGLAAGAASYGMTDTMGRMHSDAQFAGSSSVPAQVEMMGFLGMGNSRQAPETR